MRKISLGAQVARGFPQSSKDVLRVDDRIVDDLADGDRQATERERVQAFTHLRQQDDRHQQRQRDGRQRDERDAEVEQKDEEHDGDQHPADQQRRADAAHRREDEVRRPEQVTMQRQLIRVDHGRHLVDGGVQRARHLHRVRAVLRTDLEHDAGTPHDRGVADLGFGAVGDHRDVLQPNGPVVRDVEHHLAQSSQPLTTDLVSAARSRCVGVSMKPAPRTPVADFAAVMTSLNDRWYAAKRSGVDLHLQFPNIAAEGGDARHAGHAQQIAGAGSNRRTCGRPSAIADRR